MNILFVINYLEIGGAETFLLRLIKELKTSGVKPYLFLLAPEKNNPTFAKYFLEETRVTIVPDIQKQNPIKEFFLLKINGLCKRLFNKTFYEKYLEKKRVDHFKKLLLEQYKIDLINSHLFSADLFSAEYLKPILKRPLVATFQGCYNDLEEIESARTVLTQIDGFTYVAAKNLSIFERVRLPIPTKNRLVYNGLPKPDFTGEKTRSELNLSESDFIVGQISRTIPSKGMEIAANAVVHLVENENFKDLKLILIGPENEYYQSLKSKFSNKPFILFPGSAINPIAWINLFDVGILPSYFPSESCPSSIVEYLAGGKPAIASDIGEIPNMITYEGELGGAIVGEKDDQNIPSFMHFAAAIRAYFTDRSKLKSDSLIATKAFDKFLIDKSARKYLELYNEVLNSYQ